MRKLQYIALIELNGYMSSTTSLPTKHLLSVQILKEHSSLLCDHSSLSDYHYMFIVVNLFLIYILFCYEVVLKLGALEQGCYLTRSKGECERMSFTVKVLR